VIHEVILEEKKKHNQVGFHPTCQLLPPLFKNGSKSSNATNIEKGIPEPKVTVGRTRGVDTSSTVYAIAKYSNLNLTLLFTWRFASLL
jgi:hypothetical protein